MPPLLIKGDQVSFLRASDKKEIFLPPHFCIVHDVKGALFRGCDFFIVPVVFVRNGISHSDIEMRNEAEKYYGNLDELCEVRVDLPRKGWKNPVDVTTIRYRREGFLKAPYEHEYASPQPLLHCSKHGVWKIVSPDFCIANERGFVHP